MLSLYRRALTKRTLQSLSRSAPARLFSGQSTKPEKMEAQSEGKDRAGESQEPVMESPEGNGKKLDEMATAQDKLKQAEASLKSTHHQLLLKYAEAENKRRERQGEIKKRDTANVSKFAEKVADIFASLEDVCTVAASKIQAESTEERVKSLSEGLFMTRDIMKNILAKHNVEPKPRK